MSLKLSSLGAGWCERVLWSSPTSSGARTSG